MATSSEDFEELPDKVMLWDDNEMERKYVEQVGVSACGATAVVNLLVRIERLRRAGEREAARENLREVLTASFSRFLSLFFSLFSLLSSRRKKISGTRVEIQLN